MPNISKDNLEKLITVKKAEGNTRHLKAISDFFKLASEYHAAILEMEAWMKLNDSTTLDREEYQAKRMELDKQRRSKHNLLLIQVSMLNRIANNAGLEPIYDGTISEDRPYRRQVANAVLAFIETLVQERA